MSMRSQPFLWRTIIGRCWPGVHRKLTHEESAQKGMVCQKSGKIMFSQGKSCYHVADEMIRLHEQKLSWIFPGQRDP